MFTEAVTIGELKTKSPSCKRTKVVESKHSGSKHPATPRVVHISEEGDVIVVVPPKRQYLTRSRATATTCLSQQEKQKSKAPDVAPKPLSSSDDIVPSSTF